MNDPELGTEVLPGVFVIPYFRDQHVVTIGARRVAIYTEMACDDIDYFVDMTAQYRWMPPFEMEGLSEEETKVAVNAVLKYFDSQNIRCASLNVSPPQN